MKIYKYITVGVVAAAMTGLTACDDYLDKQMVTSLNEDIVFSSYENAINVANSVYGDLPQGLQEIGGSAMMASACDEAEFTIQTATVQRFNDGSWMATNMPDNPFAKYYKSISKVYNFIDNADRINFDDVRDNPDQPGTYEKYLANIESYKGEVKLLRAFYMFELVKRFGGVPIVDGKISYGDDNVNLQRNTLEECVDEIVKACDEAALILPVKHQDTELGRLTKGAALALKSEVLLFAASDLWNNPSWAMGYEHPELISLPNGDRAARWKAAADAAKAVIDLERSAGYALDTYTSLFGATGYKSKEVIFCRRDDKTNSFEKTNLPIGFDQATGGNCPSQNLVDAFMTKEGSGSNITSRPFDWSNLTMAADPYNKRDPRLKLWIVTNGSNMKSRTVECWKGGLDGEGVRNCTPTGYYIKKFLNTSLDLTRNETAVHTWVFFRLAEIYLNYIEALNEYDPGNANIKTYYDKLRNRTGVKMPGMASGLSQDEVRQLIRNERRIELCFEGKRFFDLRRWMDVDALKAPLRGVSIEKNGSNAYVYSPIKIEDRVFDPKMYFYPIPQAEINKQPGVMIQNPGW